MARRRSAAERLYRAYRKRQQAKEQERRRQARANERVQRELEADEHRRQREAERTEIAQQRYAEKQRQQRAAQEERDQRQLLAQAQRELERADREKARKVAQIERDLQRREADRDRQRARLKVEERRAEVELRTSAVRMRVGELERLLLDRPSLIGHRDRVGTAVEDGGPGALVDAVHAALAFADYPHGLRSELRVAFHLESRELLVDCELPRRDVIPAVVGYRFVQSTDEARPEPRKEAEIKGLYRQLIARIALRTLAEIFDVTPPALVDSVIFNGHVSAKDRATGKAIRPCLVSVNGTRELVDDLVPDEPELDAVLCLAHLNAIVSPHPYDLEAVRPVIEFDLTKYNFIKEVDIVAGLDSRADLLALTPGEFEQLVRALFEAIGMKAWVTQASRDEGVDAVAVNEDPIVGGLCVIQAKRYKDVVGLESVHALAGAMNHKNATKGILVTTSWFGKASRDFAKQNGRIELIDGRNLKALVLEHLDRDVLIGLPKVPRDWTR